MNDALEVGAVTAETVPPDRPDKAAIAAYLKHIRIMLVELEIAAGLPSRPVRVVGRYSELKLAISEILALKGPLSRPEVEQELERRGIEPQGAQSVRNALARNFKRIPGYPVSKWALPE